MKTILALTSLAFVPVAAFAGDEIHINDCPEAVKLTIRQNLRDGKLDDIERYRTEAGELYVAEVNLPQGRDLKIHVQADGKLLKIREDFSFAEVPAAVKATIQGLLTDGARVDDVDKQVAGDVTTFHVEIDRKQARDLDVVIAIDGKIISQKEDMED